MDTLERLEQLQAAQAENRRQEAELRGAIADDERRVAEAQGTLQRLQVLGRKGPPAALGEAMLALQEASAGLEATRVALQPQLAELATSAEKLQADLTNASNAHERRLFTDMVAAYERLMQPAWALADKIRAQAARCSLRLEQHGPLLDRECCTIAGYPLSERVAPAPAALSVPAAIEA